jgi:Flp pilus assembly protein TadB
MSQRRNEWALRLTITIATAVVIVTLVRGSWILAVVLTTVALCWGTWQTSRNRKLREERDSAK